MKVSDWKYAVSFNICIDGEEVGDAYRESVDFVGDDIDELAEEVRYSDPDYPLVFKRQVCAGGIVGKFYDIPPNAEDEIVVALMFTQDE